MWREWLWRLILISTAIDAAYLGFLPILSLAGAAEDQGIDAVLRARGDYYGLMQVILLLASIVARVLLAGLALTMRGRMFSLLSLLASAAWVTVVVEEQSWIFDELDLGDWADTARLRLLVSEVASFGLAAIAFAAAALARGADRNPVVPARPKPVGAESPGPKRKRTGRTRPLS